MSLTWHLRLTISFILQFKWWYKEIRLVSFYKIVIIYNIVSSVDALRAEAHICSGCNIKQNEKSAFKSVNFLFSLLHEHENPDESVWLRVSQRPESGACAAFTARYRTTQQADSWSPETDEQMKRATTTPASTIWDLKVRRIVSILCTLFH